MRRGDRKGAGWELGQFLKKIIWHDYLSVIAGDWTQEVWPYADSIQILSLSYYICPITYCQQSQLTNTIHFLSPAHLPVPRSVKLFVWNALSLPAWQVYPLKPHKHRAKGLPVLLSPVPRCNMKGTGEFSPFTTACLGFEPTTFHTQNKNLTHWPASPFLKTCSVHDVHKKVTKLDQSNLPQNYLPSTIVSGLE